MFENNNNIKRKKTKVNDGMLISFTFDLMLPGLRK